MRVVISHSPLHDLISEDYLMYLFIRYLLVYFPKEVHYFFLLFFHIETLGCFNSILDLMYSRCQVHELPWYEFHFLTIISVIPLSADPLDRTFLHASLLPDGAE